MDQPSQTSLDTVLYRSRVVFLTILIIFLGSFLGAVYIGMESGEIKKNLEILGKKQQAFMKSLEPLPTPTPIDLQMYPTTIPTEEPTPTSEIYYKPAPTATPTQTNYNYNYTFPTHAPFPTFAPFPTHAPFPTAVPGAPGSAEWKAKFEADNAKMHADYEAMKQEICARSPSLCD